MVVTTIYVTRHGFRLTWYLDPRTGIYSTPISSPTDIPSDPPLAAYGVQQSHQLATALTTFDDPPITQVYSSPFYRCLQTVQPFVELKGGLEIRGDNGLGEWYPLAPFPHPPPAAPSILRPFFPSYSKTYIPSLYPPYLLSSSASKSPCPSVVAGESPLGLHDRVFHALSHIISFADSSCASNPVAILLVTHAATLIAAGRVLTGNMPSDVKEKDFRPFTCSISKFVRRAVESGVRNGSDGEKGVVKEWKGGKGVKGGWDCVVNGDCSHLDGGEERGWHFSGDESFGDAGLQAHENQMDGLQEDALGRNTGGKNKITKL